MKDGSASNPGPDSGALKGVFPASDLPPASDHGSVKQFWSSMTLAHRRIQQGGWARQVNVTDFPIAKDMAGVNMRLEAGDLWYFPQGLPHSIQGLGPDGCEFLLVFDDGTFSEDDTTLISDWLIHTPREVVARNFGVGEAALKPFDDIPPNGKYISPAPVPPPCRRTRRR